MSTSALAVQKLVVLLVVKKKLAAVANPVRIPGKAICAAASILLTTPPNYPWRKLSDLNANNYSPAKLAVRIFHQYA